MKAAQIIYAQQESGARLFDEMFVTDNTFGLIASGFIDKSRGMVRQHAVVDCSGRSRFQFWVSAVGYVDNFLGNREQMSRCPVYLR